MITKDKFLVSFTIKTYSRPDAVGFCEPMDLAYRTEEMNPYLRTPNMDINLDHLHCRRALKYIEKNLGIDNILSITLNDFIRIPDPKNDNHKIITL